MKRNLLSKLTIGSLATAGILAGAGAVNAQQMVMFEDSYDFTNTNYDTILELPLFDMDAVNGNLTKVTLTATSSAQGNYILEATGGTGDEIIYGLPNSEVGGFTQMTSTVGGVNISLTPTPTTTVGSGTLDPDGTSLLEFEIDPVEATDEVMTMFTAQADLDDFMGTGNFSIDVMGLSNITVSKSGSPFAENADILSNGSIKVIYEYEPKQVEDTPEPASMLGLGLIGGLGLLAKRQKS